MRVRFAFAGFGHGHIQALYNLAQQSDDVEVVAACEEDAATRDRLASAGRVRVTHAKLDDMLSQVDCEVVAVGDYFGNRGSIAIRALESGRHVIADKPICTRLDELDRIEQLSAARGLKVGCMFDMRWRGEFVTLRRLVQSGRIGDVGAISFNGQHPLDFGARPQWYFEPGKHGGVLNDIGVHAFDALPWITGLRFSTVLAARCWNAFVGDHPNFKDGAQAMLTMENGCGVLGDVSYFSPSRIGYRFPFSWRVTVWGRKGVADLSVPAEKVLLALSDAKEVEYVKCAEVARGGYLNAFLNDIAGNCTEGDLRTEDVLRASRIALKVQQAADRNLHDVDLQPNGPLPPAEGS